MTHGACAPWKSRACTCLCAQEVNSVEAIKSSVEANLGVAFLSTASIEKEVALGRLSALTITGTPESSLHPTLLSCD